MAMERCKVCGDLLPVQQGSGRRLSYCPPPKGCKYRAYRGRTIYNLTPEQYQALCIAQENKCAICGTKEPLVVDHDHATGVVRGLLCSACKHGLGRFKDNTLYLSKAIAYLQQASVEHKE